MGIKGVRSEVNVGKEGEERKRKVDVERKRLHNTGSGWYGGRGVKG